jgi:hypothetical protein
MSVSSYSIRFIKAVIEMLPRGRSRRYGGKLLLRSVIGRNTKEREATQQLWRGAMVQMKALNTATAWPSQLPQETRAMAKVRIKQYFAEVGRIIAAERLSASVKRGTRNDL